MAKSRSVLLFYALNLLILIPGCRSDASIDELAYPAEIRQWQKERQLALTAPDGWVALAGLFWLEPGINSFGRDTGNTMVFPGNIPATLGAFHLRGDTVLMEMTSGNRVKINGLEVDSYPLSATETAPMVQYGHLTWTLIERGDKYGIRLWDRERPQLQAAIHIDAYPLDPNWRLPAQWVPDEEKHTVRYRNVVDMEIEMETAGRLRFERDGKQYELTALDGGEEELFLVFADATTGEATYGGGRYLYTSRPDSTGLTYLDFNKAHNPPCAFTTFATCLLPPAENRLELAITAGELDYGGHE